MKQTVAVVGAGITGVTTAYYLAQQGFDVTVYEQEHYEAMRTSFANGGQVSVSNSEVWTTWSNVNKGLRWMFQKDAPLLVRPRLDPAQWRWMLKFLWHTIAGHYEKNTMDTIDMGLESRKLYAHMIQQESLHFDQLHAGILHFYKDPKYLASAAQAQRLYHWAGCDWDMVTPEQITQQYPQLADVDHLLGGAVTASDWTGDIHKFCRELCAVLKSKYHVNFVFDTQPRMQMLLDNFDAVVVCAGVGSVDLAQQVGDRLDIYPVKGYSITIELDAASAAHAPHVSLLDDQAKIVTARLGNRFRVAGTAELAGENYDIRRDRIEPLLKWVHVNFPKINTQNYSSWACLRPMTPNMMPIVKQSHKHGRVFYNTGHGHLGWTLAPATANKIAKIVKDTI